MVSDIRRWLARGQPAFGCPFCAKLSARAEAAEALAATYKAQLKWFRVVAGTHVYYTGYPVYRHSAMHGMGIQSPEDFNAALEAATDNHPAPEGEPE